MSGARIRERRKSLRISRDKLAALLGVSPGSVQNWEGDVFESILRAMNRAERGNDAD